MKKDTFYFSHDSNAFHDPKIIKLRAKHGLEGYGFYWALIEHLRNQPDYSINEDDLELLPFYLNADESKIKQMLNTCFSIGLLINQESKVFSCSLLRRMEKADEIRKKRSEAGRMGGRPKANGKQNESKTKALKESKVKESKKEIEQRKQDFREITKKAWIDKGGESYLEQDDVWNFFGYWTEHGPNDRLMRFEKENSFGVGRRLATWRKNSNKNNNPNVRVNP